MSLVLAEQSDPFFPGQTEEPKRSRGPDRFPRGKRNMHPTVREITADGERAVAVSLSGGMGQGKEMILDADVWPWVRDTFGPCWVLCSSNSHRPAYVCSGVRRTWPGTTHRLDLRRMNLARLIATNGAPKEKQAVAYRTGNRLDLRRANLRIMPHRETWNHRPDMPPPVIVDGWV